VPFVWLLAAGAVGAAAAIGGISPAAVTRLFPWEILAIYAALELFSGLLVATGALDVVAVRTARLSRGKQAMIMVSFSLLLFSVGLGNNNLTSILVSLPAMLVLLRSIELTRRYANAFFGLILGISNCGGAATPVGDFPAILIVGSGVISFRTYLVLAFPLFALTALTLVVVYRVLFTSRGSETDRGAPLSIRLLEARHRHRQVNRPALHRLAAVFAGMLFVWMRFDAAVVPPAVVAWIGVAVAAVVLSPTGVAARFEQFDLDPVLRISAVLLVAAVAMATGAIDRLADVLTDHIDNPLMLLLAVMCLTTVLCGVFEAGATAAAMLPLIHAFTGPGGALHDMSAIAVVAFAASICAGSSMLLTSATAGQLLAAKVRSAQLITNDGLTMEWGFRAYLPFGLLNCAIQFAVAVAWTVAALAIGGHL
jgi:Na+/H+ antiporter NhaD/arsenite permease-like protein